MRIYPPTQGRWYDPHYYSISRGGAISKSAWSPQIHLLAVPIILMMALAAWGIACYTTAGASQDEIDALHTNGAKVLPEETASRLHMHKIGKAHLGEQVTAFGEDIFEYEEEPPLSLGQQGHR